MKYFLFFLFIILLLISCGDSTIDLKRFSKIKREFTDIKAGWILAAENKYLKLKINGETAEFELLYKPSGKSWFSNPQMEDPLASGINRSYLKSQFRISYFNDRSIRKTMNSYDDAVLKGQFEIQKIENGAKVTYTLGEVDDIELIPQAINAKRFDSFYGKITDTKYKSQINRQYKKIDLDTLTTEKLKKEYLLEYPQLKEGPFYEFSDLSNKAVRERIELGFIQAGYTIDDLKLDNHANNIKAPDPNIELFTFTLYYDLKDDQLIVHMPTDEMYYHSTYPLTTLRVLEFFGASREGSAKEGYLFVPDGSGALIDFDNGKNYVDIFYGKIYGNDPAVPVVEKGMKQLPVLLPVFGMKQDDDAFLAVIEDGDAHGNIFADVSGRINSYNYVGSDFLILPFAPVTLEGLQGNKFVNTYQQEPFQGEIKIAYNFLSGEMANYSGMAARYSSMLFGEDSGLPLLTKDTPEVLLDFYMAIDKTKHFLGIPYKGLEVLTSLQDVEDIVLDLDKRNIRNRILNIIGWEQGGVYHNASLVSEPALGSAEKRKKLVSSVKDTGDFIFFDGSVTRVLENTLFDGYDKDAHTVQLLDRNDARLFPVGLSTGTADRSMPPYYLVGPERGKKFYWRAFDLVKNYGIPGFAFRFAGNYLHSDFYEHHEVPRQKSKTYTLDLFNSMKESGAKILVRGGNAYSLTQSDVISDMPLTSNDYMISDRSVPFVQMVLSGKRYYSGKAINLSDQETSTFLKYIETGALPHFSVIKRDNSLVVDTYHNYLYSVNYDKLSNEIQDWVSKLSAVRSLIASDQIVSHRFLKEEVVLVEYANDTQVVINYSKQTYQFKDILINGEDYTIVR